MPISAAIVQKFLILRQDRHYNFIWHTPTGAHWHNLTLTAQQEQELARDFAQATQEVAYRFQADGAKRGQADKMLLGLGRNMFHRLLSEELRQQLRVLPVNALLCLVTNDTLLPWELLMVDDTPLALRHGLSRQWLTTQHRRTTQWFAKPRLNCLLIGDPTGDLRAAEQEIEAVIEVLDTAPQAVHTTWFGGKLEQEAFLALLAKLEYDLVHFAGHARPGALRLADGWLAAEHIQQAIKGNPFIFLNACASAQEQLVALPEVLLDRAGSTLPYTGQGINSLAAAFLTGGASGFLGTLWPVPDEAARQLAVDFYRLALQGYSTGEALQRARLRNHQQAAQALVWAAATLYGDPLQQLFANGPQQRTGSVLVVEPPRASRQPPAPVTLAEQTGDQQRMAQWSQMVNDYGGRMVAITPTQLVAVFGADQLLEDDAERALLTGLALLSPLHSGKEQLPAVGIASGPFTITEQPAHPAALLHYTGAAVTTALQLARLAQPGEVLVNDRTYQLVPKRFTFTAVVDLADPVDILAGATPVPVDSGYHRLVIDAQQNSERRPLLLVEREDALTTLHKSWRRAEQGQGKVVAIAGERGSGKSTVVETFCARYAAQPIRRLQLAAVSVNLNIPLSFLADFLRLLLEIDPRTDHATTWARVEERLAAFPALATKPGLLDRLFEILRVPRAGLEEEDRKRLRPLIGQLVRGLLESASAPAPLLVWWQNAHYIDADSLNLLTSLTERIDEQPLLLLLSYRTGWKNPWESDSTPIKLDPLSAQGAQILLQQLLASDRLPIALQEAFRKLDALAGNPGDIVDWVGYLQDTGILRRETGLWQITRPLQVADLPETIKRTQLAQIKALDPAQQQTLRVAAVVDQGFTPRLLAEVLAETEADLTERLATLQVKRLLRAAPHRDGYQFTKAKLRDVLYAELPHHQQATLHRAVADALRDDPDVSLFQVAHHYAQSNDRASAVRYGLRAAEQAATEWNNQSSLDQYTRAAAKVKALLESKPTVLEEKRGATAAMLITWQRSSLEGCADIQSRIDQKPQAILLYNQLLASAPNPPPLPEPRQANLWRKLAIAHQYLGQSADAQQAIDHGLALLAGVNCVEHGQLSLQQAMLLYSRSEHSQALAVSQAASEHLLDTPRDLAQTRNLQTILYCRLGRIPEAITAGEESVAIYRSLADLLGLGRALSNLGIAYDEVGRWAEARQCYQESYAVNSQTGDVRALSSAAIDLGESYRYRGDLEPAMGMYQIALDAAQQAEDRQTQIAVRINQSMVALKRQQFAEAAAYLAASEPLLVASQLYLYRPELGRLQAEVQLGQHQLPQAQATAQQALRWAVEADDQLEIALVQRTLACVCAALGDAPQADQLFAASLAALRQQQRPYELGLTLLAQATWLAEKATPHNTTDEGQLAQSCCQEALSLFETLGAQLDQQAAQRQLDRLHAG